MSIQLFSSSVAISHLGLRLLPLIRFRVQIKARYLHSHSQKIPFKISRQDANAKFANAESFFESRPLSVQAPSTSVVISKKDPVKECFLPFYTANIAHLKSRFIGEYGRDRYVTTYMTISNGKSVSIVPITTVVTDWYSTSGTLKATDYPVGTHETQLYGDFLYPRQIIEKALNSNQLEDYLQAQPSHLSQSQLTYPHRMRGEFAMEKINSRIYELEMKRALSHILSHHGADRSRVTSLNVQLSSARIQLMDYHVPSYIWETDAGSLKIIHGHNGHLDGDRRLSAFRTALFGTGVAGFLGLVGLRVLGGPVLSSLHLAGTLIAGGVSSGLFSQFYNSIKTSSNQSQIADDLKRNEEYIETEEDRHRRQRVKESNTEWESISQNQVQLPIDQCRILNLDPTTSLITLQMVKEAYHCEIKKWHPDVYQGDRHLAQSMSIQINSAYNNLHKLLNHNKTPVRASDADAQ